MTSRAGMLVDSSALIAYLNPSDAHHAGAVAYIEAAIKGDVPLFLSSLSVAEVCTRLEPEHIDENVFIIQGFEAPEAALAGRLDSNIKRDAGDNRMSLKIDVMLIAHAEKLGLMGILTADTATLAKYCDRLRALRLVELFPVITSDPFDPAKIFNPAVTSMFSPGLSN